VPQVHPRVELLRFTPLPEQAVAMAGRLCYSQADLSALADAVSSRDQSNYLKKVSEMGHLSLLEHAGFTFGIEGVSRSLMAQITRHRIASFSVQSQRYVALGGEGRGFDYVVPPAIEALGPEEAAEFGRQMDQIDAWYQHWREKLGGERASNEDARFVLPNAAATRIIATMNARELKHFCALRCCRRAQWEIREVATRMLALAYREAPALFAAAGPGCISGPCPEGKMTCGRMAAVKQEFEDMRARIDAERQRSGERHGDQA